MTTLPLLPPSPSPLLPSAAVLDLTVLANRTEVTRVYQDVKTYICCTLTGSSSSLFVSWTVAGSVGLAWAIMCSGIMMYAAATARKRLKPGMPVTHGGAMLWAAPPPPTNAGGGGEYVAARKPSEIEPVYSTYAQQQPQPQQAFNGAIASVGPSGSVAATVPLI